MQSRITKNAKGYGYKYTDLSGIHKLLEENGLSYYQFVLTEDGADYVYTVKVDADGNDGNPVRGARVVLGALSGGGSNPAQDYGSALTYARRYSLLMAYGLATTDDDAASLTQPKAQPRQNQKVAEAEGRAAIMRNFNSLTPERRQKTAAHYGFDDIVNITEEQATKYLADLKRKQSRKETPNEQGGFDRTAHS